MFGALTTRAAKRLTTIGKPQRGEEVRLVEAGGAEVPIVTGEVRGAVRRSRGLPQHPD